LAIADDAPHQLFEIHLPVGEVVIGVDDRMAAIPEMLREPCYVPRGLQSLGLHLAGVREVEQREHVDDQERRAGHTHSCSGALIARLAVRLHQRLE
jgi:hypothetical protein